MASRPLTAYGQQGGLEDGHVFFPHALAGLAARMLPSHLQTGRDAA